MTYVMSDLHGHYEKYIKMLDLIRFSDHDDLFIVGDVVDRGPQSVELLKDMSLRPNVFPIMGNHDMTAAVLLRTLCTEITEENYEKHMNAEILKLLALWQSDGGQETLDGFKKLSHEERTFLIEYLEDFTPYETIEVSGETFVLVHGGIPYSKTHLPLSEISVHELVSTRVDYSLRYLKNAYLVTGHTPTLHISQNYEGKIFRGNGHIAIDCGAGFGMNLGCIRLEDMKEFYVD